MERSTKILIGVGVIAFAMGTQMTHPETKTVTVTKTVQAPPVVSTVTKEVITPLPSSCREAIKIFPRLTESDAAQTEAVGKILLALQEKGGAIAFNEVKVVNAQTTVVRRNGAILSTASNDRQIASTTFESYLKQCEADIANTN